MERRFSPDGERVVTAADDRTARVWPAESDAAIETLRPGGWVFSVAFSPDGERVVTAGDRTVRIWDAESGAELETMRPGGESASFSSDGERVMTASGRTVRIWDAESGAELETLRGHRYTLWSAAFSPDGDRVVTASLDGTVRIGTRRAAPNSRPCGRADPSRAPPSPPTASGS